MWSLWPADIHTCILNLIMLLRVQPVLLFIRSVHESSRCCTPCPSAAPIHAMARISNQNTPAVLILLFLMPPAMFTVWSGDAIMAKGCWWEWCQVKVYPDLHKSTLNSNAITWNLLVNPDADCWSVWRQSALCSRVPRLTEGTEEAFCKLHPWNITFSSILLKFSDFKLTQVVSDAVRQESDPRRPQFSTVWGCSQIQLIS